MSTRAHRALTLLAVVIACVLPLGSAQATSSADNVATATIEQDDGRAFDMAFDIDRQSGDNPVLNRNEADAFGRCTHCRATAIAFQIVLVHGSPQTVVPQNIAQAVNNECTECTVAAEARQFVRVSPDPVKLTPGGRSVLVDVKRDLAALEQEDLPLDQLHQAVETQEARVRSVLADDLINASNPDEQATIDQRRTLQDVDVG